MEIRLMNYSKRHNSTSRPDFDNPYTVYTSYDIAFKRPTSINNPVILIDTMGDGFQDYNYAVLPSLRMYYFIEDIVMGNDEIFELHLTLDALATARPYIKASSCFAKYCSDDRYINAYLRDDRVIAAASQTALIASNNFSSHIRNNSYSSTSCYLLTSVSRDEGLVTYLLSYTEMKYIYQRILDDSDGIIGGLNQLFADAIDSITDLQLTPFSLTGLQASGCCSANKVSVYLGNYDTGQTGYVIDANVPYEASDFVDIPSGVPSDFRRCEPYCDAKIHIPLLGVHDFSLSDVADVNKIYFRYICEVVSGKCTCILYKGNVSLSDASAKAIATYEGSVNQSLPLAITHANNPTGILGAGIGVASAFLGGAFTVAGIAGAIASFASQFSKQSSVMGAYAGNAAWKDSPRLSIIVNKHDVSVEPSALKTLYGQPSGQIIASLSDVTGFIQTEEFHLLAPLDAGVINTVESMMNNGVYLE